MNGSKSLVATALVGLVAMIGAGSAASADSATHTCFGQTATIVGTPGDDMLVGREDTADVIVGLGGDDVIFGAEEPNSSTAPGDRLCGGLGLDYIKGAVGEDRIQGGAGDDDVDGSFGYDVMTRGGPGNDRVEDCDSEYTGGVRRIIGGPGNDRLCVDTDATRMFGDGGDDVLLDLTCSINSRLSGGGGNDRLKSFFENFEGMPCSESGILDADVVNGNDGVDSAIVNDGDVVSNTEVVEQR